MTAYHSGGNRDYGRFDKMSTEQLEEILRTDAQLPDGNETDEDLIFYIMGVLAERNKQDAGKTYKTAEEAYEIFQKDYLNCSQSSEPLHIDFESEQTTRRKKHAKATTRLLKGVAAAAAAVAIIFFGSLTAYAFGYDVWGAVAKWTKDTFHFEDPSSSASIWPSEEMPDTAIKSMQDELHKYQIHECLLPTWIPDRYALEDIKVTETVQFLCILGVYQHAEERMTIMVRENLKTREDLIEKDEEDVEVYEVEGVSFYIFKNYDRVKVAWMIKNYECSISGSISRDEAIAMIESIFKGE